MRTRSPFLAAAAATAAALVLAGPAGAQEAPAVPRPTVAFVELTGLHAQPLGEFAGQIDRGWGLGLGLAVPLGRGNPLRMRVDGSFINYGRETRQVCLSPTIGCRIQVRQTTSNDILSLGIGPELVLGGGGVQPFVHGFGGLAAFATSSSLRGRNDEQSFAHTTNHDDLSLSWGGGGGVRVRLPVREAPVSLQLGARYHNNGQVEYLRRGDITDLPDGSIVLNPQRSRADYLTVQLGVSAGVQPRVRPRRR